MLDYKLAARAEGHLDRLRETYRSLDETGVTLAEHTAGRYEIERQACAELMQQQRPGTEKTWPITAAMENLDLVPAFKEWRRRRNELEQESFRLMHEAEVQKREVDLAIMLVRATL